MIALWGAIPFAVRAGRLLRIPPDTTSNIARRDGRSIPPGPPLRGCNRNRLPPKFLGSVRGTGAGLLTSAKLSGGSATSQRSW